MTKAIVTARNISLGFSALHTRGVAAVIVPAPIHGTTKRDTGNLFDNRIVRHGRATIGERWQTMDRPVLASLPHNNVTNCFIVNATAAYQHLMAAADLRMVAGAWRTKPADLQPATINFNTYRIDIVFSGGKQVLFPLMEDNQLGPIEKDGITIKAALENYGKHCLFATPGDIVLRWGDASARRNYALPAVRGVIPNGKGPVRSFKAIACTDNPFPHQPALVAELALS